MFVKRTVFLGLMLSTAFLLPLGAIGQDRMPGAELEAKARPPLGPFVEIWVNDGRGNYEPSVAYNSVHDEYLAVWWTAQDLYTDDIWARRVGGDGSLRSGFNVATGPGEKRTNPVVAYSPAQDEYLVVYRYEGDDDMGDYDIRARRVSWNGGWLSPDEIIVAAGRAHQTWPAVAYNSQDDEYLVVYSVLWPAGTQEINAQRLAGDGTLLTTRTIAREEIEQVGAPAVAYNPARNEYLIAYDHWPRTPPYDRDVVGKIATATLDDLSSTEIPIAVQPQSQQSAAVATGPDEYLVVFEDGVLASHDYDIYARRLSGAGGLPQGPARGFPIAQFSSADCYRPDVAYGPSLGYVVTWFVRSTTYLDDVWGNYVATGQDQAAGQPFGMVGGMGTHESLPVVSADASGKYLMIFTEDWHWTHVGDYEVRGLFLSPYRSYLPFLRRHPLGR